LPLLLTQSFLFQRVFIRYNLKFAIAFLGSSTVAAVYGAAGSIIIILIWVYYSAIILYFGAEFTKVYANAHGNKIIPNAYAKAIMAEVVEVKKN